MYKYICTGILCLFSYIILISSAQASCGAAFCPVNTQWNTQGIWTEPGWRADLRYEYIPQNQPRSGSHTVGVGEISQHHDEVKTFNHNFLATLDYGSADNWGVTISVPIVDRDHTHIHNHMGSQFLEKWDFARIGDVQLMGRYQFTNWNNPYVYGVYLGTKLPTGQFDIKNGDGDLAERTLQPGTGTTDALVGFYARRNMPEFNSSLFAQTILQAPLNERDDYKPGNKLSVDLGYRYDVTDRTSLMLQVNGNTQGRDSGSEAEPESSGGYSVSVSPGVSYALTKTVQVYGFVQKPVYQYVNGVQLTSEWSVVTGISFHF